MTDESIRRFGETVHDHRVQRGISLRVMAERVDSSIAHLSDIEHGKTNPGLDIAMRLARFLSFSLDDLLGIDPDDMALELSEYRTGLECLRRAQRDINQSLSLLSYLGLRAGIRRSYEEVA